MRDIGFVWFFGSRSNVFGGSYIRCCVCWWCVHECIQWSRSIGWHFASSFVWFWAQFMLCICVSQWTLEYDFLSCLNLTLFQITPLYSYDVHPSLHKYYGSCCHTKSDSSRHRHAVVSPVAHHHIRKTAMIYVPWTKPGWRYRFCFAGRLSNWSWETVSLIIWTASCSGAKLKVAMQPRNSHLTSGGGMWDISGEPTLCIAVRSPFSWYVLKICRPNIHPHQIITGSVLWGGFMCINTSLVVIVLELTEAMCKLFRVLFSRYYDHTMYAVCLFLHASVQCLNFWSNLVVPSGMRCGQSVDHNRLPSHVQHLTQASFLSIVCLLASSFQGWHLLVPVPVLFTRKGS